MKKTLEQVTKILKSCESIIVDEDNHVTSFIINENNVVNFFYFRYFDVNGQDWENQFNANDNKEVEVVGSSLFLIDNDGDEIQITPLFTRDLEGRV